MKKVLFIIQSYPSEKSANVLCDEKVMHVLQKAGKYETHCLVCQYNNQPREELRDGIVIHRIRRGAFWNAYTWARHHEGIKRAKLIIKAQRILLRLKQIVTIPIYPCYEPFYANQYAKEAISLHRSEKFDLVIAEHNGFDTLYAGYRLKKAYPQIRFLPIFWDSLSGGFSAKYLPPLFCKKRKELCERLVMKVADKAIAMSSHKGHIEKTWSGTKLLDKFVFLNIPYFVKPKPQRQRGDVFLDRGKTNVVFAGSMGNRDPSYAIRLFSALGRDNVVLWIVCDKSYHEKIRTLILPNAHNIQLHDYIQNRDLAEVLGKADILLNIGVKNPNAISGKIFEYMAYGKPIISTYAIDKEACIPYINMYPLSMLVDERESEIDQQVQKVRKFIKTNRNMRIDFEKIVSMFKENTPQAYAEIIEELVEES